ncbi:hypothetical protein P691DRAFT_787144 [Macrolepiota fuliginosa MF-IS2]|uniref:WD40 repeat-like protein n=1 Tax=Macrolepiota fuliginosa MF-IS2 TaxID=1400762 RepID=A0A9P6C004_9AGAR|nr:hypothetical protein P691DRAFT_787144 [Macrolepiota fuliginosa MF-IS2]
MGKSKSKKSQPKRYPTPTDKYLIVTDPWGGVPLKTSDFFNNVTAWFEIMLKPKYPGARPSAIFYQFTNKNIIVEIPDNIDVEPYLGTHYWSSFLLPPHCYEVGARASYIYEFETRFFPTPAAQGGWTAGYAQYTRIRPDFFVREPYPAPLPAQNSSLAFARKLPPGRHAEVAQMPPLPMLLPDPIPVPENTTLLSPDPGGPPPKDLSTDNQRNNEARNKSRSPTRARSETLGAQVLDPRRRYATASRNTPHLQPYKPPSHLAEVKAHLANDTPSQPSDSMPPPPLPASTNLRPANKMDPYEEEEAAAALLRSPTASASPTRGLSVKSEVEVKQELLPPDHTEEYMPSLALQEAFRSLQTPTDDFDDLPDFIEDEEEEIRVKVEVQGGDYQPSTDWAQAFSSLDQSGSGSSSDIYTPSESLLSALASLPGGMVDVTSPPMSSGEGARVKSEPQEGIPFAASTTDNTVANDRERSMTLLSEPSSARVRIKHRTPVPGIIVEPSSTLARRWESPISFGAERHDLYLVVIQLRPGYTRRNQYQRHSPANPSSTREYHDPYPIYHTTFDVLRDYLPQALRDNATSRSPSRAHTLADVGGSRREAILSIVEMLLQSDETAKRKEQVPSFEADRDLRNFANAARQLGSSVAILSSAVHLRERLAQILFLYRENAAVLFPREISRAPKESIIDPQNTGSHRSRKRHSRAPSHIVRPSVNEDIDIEEIPDQIDCFAKDIGTFLDCLNEFPEFTDEAMNASILSFERDLQYWASCLKEYSGQFRTPAVQRYLHELSIEMGEHIDGITSTLSIFIEVGVPTIQFAQKHGATNLLNLSTLATLFSAITATTMQFSYNLGNDPLITTVNSFWFASLVFSIAAAVNSLLGLTWKQAMYRSPGYRVPWWVLIWIKGSPLLFLIMSVACFSIGLCFFTYASGQAPVTSTITTVLTALTSFGLCAVSAWFAAERWIFMRHGGKKWLDDVLIKTTDTMLQNHVGFFRQESEKVGRVVVAASSVIGPVFPAIRTRLDKLVSRCSCISNSSNDSENVLPVSHVYNSSGTHSTGHHPKEGPTNDPNAYSRRRPSEAALTPQMNGISPMPGVPRSSIGSFGETPLFDSAKSKPHPANNTLSTGKQRWRDALHAVRISAAISGASSPPVSKEPSRRGTTPSDVTNKRRAEGVIAKSRLTELVPKLKALQASQDLAAHTALVKHLQFSPDGKYLATSSWDRTSVIFKVGRVILTSPHQDPFLSHRVLAHVRGFVGQVAWSPDGKYLLTKMTRGMKVWTAEDGVCKKTIEREEPVEAITWCHYDHKFLSVEGSKVYQLDITGRQINVFDLGSIKIHDVAVTPDDRRALAVGPLLRSPGGLLPSKSRAEKRLIVFNMELQQIEYQVPVLNDVRDITLAETIGTGLVALISYENKAAPQLWKLEIVKDRENGRESSRLTLRHTYMPKSAVDFAGPSYFGGRNHELVLCAGKNYWNKNQPNFKAGDIFIWDTESGALLHHIHAQAHGGDLTCIAWNHAMTNPFMFASGSHDGTVRIWTKPPTELDIIPVDEPARDHACHYEDALSEHDQMSRANSIHDDLDLDFPPETNEGVRELEHNQYSVILESTIR